MALGSGCLLKSARVTLSTYSIANSAHSALCFSHSTAADEGLTVAITTSAIKLNLSIGQSNYEASHSQEAKVQKSSRLPGRPLARDFTRRRALGLITASNSTILEHLAHPVNKMQSNSMSSICTRTLELADLPPQHFIIVAMYTIISSTSFPRKFLIDLLVSG